MRQNVVEVWNCFEEWETETCYIIDTTCPDDSLKNINHNAGRTIKVIKSR